MTQLPGRTEHTVYSPYWGGDAHIPQIRPGTTKMDSETGMIALALTIDDHRETTGT